jgi:hypothetical protein
MYTMKKLVTLDWDDSTNSFFEDAKMLGVVAPLNDYYFIWHVNALLGYRFRAIPEATIQLLKRKSVQKKQKAMDFFFSVFEYNVPGYALQHLIYHNQNKGEPLLPDYKHIDFIWLMKGDFEYDEDARELVQALKSINGVQLVTEIPIDKVRKKEHLVL